MACKYLAPNKKPSKLYDAAYKEFGSLEAEALFFKANDPVFINKWDDILDKDSNGEFTYESIKKFSLVEKFRKGIGPKYSKENRSISRQIDHLTATFGLAGVDVNVNIDPNLEASGEVETIEDGSILITYNPNKAGSDTIWHEHGHILVDMLGGLSNPKVAAGVDILRGTKLWNKIVESRPELTGEDLAKEVLVTSIGIEAAAIDSDKSIIRQWKIWFNNLIKGISSLLGIRETLSKSLAKQLVNGNIEELLDTTVKIKRQRQLDLKVVNDIYANKQDIMQKIMNTIEKKLKIYFTDYTDTQKNANTVYKNLTELQELLRNYADADQSEGLIAFLKEMTTQIGKIEERVTKIVNLEKDTTSKEIQSIRNYISAFDLIEDVNYLTTFDPEFIKKVKELDFQKNIDSLLSRHNKVKKQLKRVAVRFMGNKFGEKASNKVFGLRRKELRAEYNKEFAEERKASRKKGGNTLRDFRAKRTSEVNRRIKAEERDLIRQANRRYTYLLQQVSKDISYLERMFLDGDAVSDEIVQLTIEMLDEADFSTMQKDIEEYKKANVVFEEFNKVKTQSSQVEKYDEMIEDAVDYNPTTNTVTKKGAKQKTNKLIAPYYSLFYQLKKEAWAPYYEAQERGASDEEIKLAMDAAIAWMNKNTIDLREEIRGEYKWAPADHWINPQYDKMLSLREKESPIAKMYDYIIAKLIAADNMLPESAKLGRSVDGYEEEDSILQFKLPSVKKKGLERIFEDGIINHVKDRTKNLLSKEDDTEFGTDLNQELKELQENDELPENMEGEGTIFNTVIKRTVELLADEKQEIKNRIPVNFRYSMPIEDQSFDLTSITLLNLHMARNYQTKENIAADVELTTELLKERNVNLTRGSFLNGVRYVTDRLFKNQHRQTPLIKSGADSNSYKALKSIVEDRLYGLSTRSSVQATKLTNALAAFTGSVMLIGNYLSSGANLAFGDTANWIEATGGVFFDRKNLAKAHVLYTKELTNMSIIKDFGARVYSSKTNLLMEQFNSLSDWRAVAQKFVADTRMKQLMKTSNLHALNNSAEHFIQNILMYAVLDRIKVLNENGEYLTKDGTTTDPSKAMTYHEAFTVENHRLILDPRARQIKTHAGNLPADDSGIFQVSRMIRDLNANLQGQYSHEKKSEIQRYWYGTLVMLLRKWMPRGITRRWRGFEAVGVPIEQLGEDDIFYSTALQHEQEGYYTTTGRLLYRWIRELKRLKWDIRRFEKKKSWRRLESSI
jgi:hypothetical protein